MHAIAIPLLDKHSVGDWNAYPSSEVGCLPLKGWLFVRGSDHELPSEPARVLMNGRWLLTFINHFPDFSKIEASKFELPFALFDLDSCIENEFN